MKTTCDRLVDEYLKRLRAALGDLPRDRRRAVREGVAARIAAERARSGPESEQGIRTLLERVGDPLEIAAAERTQVVPGPSTRPETTTILLLLLGGLVFLVGWLVGVVRLWRSGAWTTRDKLIGTLVVPGGLGMASFLILAIAYNSSSSGPQNADCGASFAASACASSGGRTNVGLVVALVVLVAAPLATGVYLARRMNVPAPG